MLRLLEGSLAHESQVHVFRFFGRAHGPAERDRGYPRWIDAGHTPAVQSRRRDG